MIALTISCSKFLYVISCCVGGMLECVYVCVSGIMCVCVCVCVREREREIERERERERERDEEEDIGDDY